MTHDLFGVVTLKRLIAPELVVGQHDLLGQAVILKDLQTLLLDIARRVSEQIHRRLVPILELAVVRRLRLLQGAHSVVILRHLDLMAFLLHAFGRLVVTPLPVLVFQPPLDGCLLPPADLLTMLLLHEALLAPPVGATGVQRLAVSLLI